MQFVKYIQNLQDTKRCKIPKYRGQHITRLTAVTILSAPSVAWAVQSFAGDTETVSFVRSGKSLPSTHWSVSSVSQGDTGGCDVPLKHGLEAKQLETELVPVLVWSLIQHQFFDYQPPKHQLLALKTGFSQGMITSGATGGASSPTERGHRLNSNF